MNALNYCRAPDSYGQPKCFIDNRLTSCDIAKCGKNNFFSLYQFNLIQFKQLTMNLKVGCPEVPFVQYSTFRIEYAEIEDDGKSVSRGSILTYKCLAGNLIGSSSVRCINAQWIPSSNRTLTSFPRCHGNLIFQYLLKKTIFLENN